MNGHQHHFGDTTSIAGSSKAHPALNGSNVHEQVPDDVDVQMAEERLHADHTVSHLYESGYLHGNFSDITVHVGTAVYRLHALILSRSPYLVHLMSTSPYKDMIYIPIEQYPDVTLEAMAIALGYLYSYQAIKMVSTANARATLASGCLLGGMDDLCAKAYNICKDSIRVDTIEDWLAWTDAHFSPPSSSIPPSTPGGGGSGTAAGAHIVGASALNGHSPSTSAPSTPRSPSSPSPLSSAGQQQDRQIVAPSIFGPYAQLLRDDVLEFLIVALPAILMTDSNTTTSTLTTSNGHQNGGESVKSEINGEALEALLRVFSRVSFDVFKTAMESPKFFIGSDHDRFRFAKAAIAKRKQFAGRGAEESVVLAVGEGRGNLHVSRKLRRKALWKVAK